ncbi:hypothetical protein N8Z04_00155 [bacterium]|jgi:hypothetical protein|nr:hypothetical protein [bacterium]
MIRKREMAVTNAKTHADWMLVAGKNMMVASDSCHDTDELSLCVLQLKGSVMTRLKSINR